MVIPGVPPSISLNSASNSRQGGRPTLKVINNYSFYILGLRIISSTIYLTVSLFSLSTRNSGRLCLKQLFPKGEDDISEEIHLELDLPSFDRWIYILDHPSELRSMFLDIYCWSSISVESKLSEVEAEYFTPIHFLNCICSQLSQLVLFLFSTLSSKILEQASLCNCSGNLWTFGVEVMKRNVK